MHRVERATVAPETLRCHPGAGDTRRRRWEPHSDGGGGGRRQDVIFINVRNDKKPHFSLKLYILMLVSQIGAAPAPGGTNWECPHAVPNPRDSFAWEKGTLGKLRVGFGIFFFFSTAAFGVKWAKESGSPEKAGKPQGYSHIPKLNFLGFVFLKMSPDPLWPRRLRGLGVTSAPDSSR